MIYNSDPDGAPNLAEAKRLAAIESHQNSERFLNCILDADWLFLNQSHPSIMMKT